MSGLSILEWVLASSSMTLALIHVSVWWRDRSARAHLAFALLAVGVALFGLLELSVMRAATVEEFATRLRWLHVPIFMMVIGIVAFITTHFGTGRPWLARAACGLNLLTLIVGFVRPPNVDFSALDGIRQVTLLGEPVTVGVGVTSAWHWVGQIGFLLLVAFVVDASVTVWRNGDAEGRRRALAIGGTVGGFGLAAAGQAALVYGGVVTMPTVGAPLFLPVLIAMGHDLSNQVLRAARLTHEVQENAEALRASEQRMRTAAADAQQLSRRLISAQEEERRRIARELHDDVGQRLAVVALDLAALQQTPADDRASGRFGHVMSEVRALSSDLHALSYRLHPAKLDQLGLVTTAKGWCRDQRATSGIAIEFLHDGFPDDLRGAQAVGLFRILQEATRNVARHSNAASARVVLSRSADRLQLVVEDDGRGFVVDSAIRSRGLGLLSMEERARALGGRLVLESRPGHGTRVEVVVPVTPGDRPDDPGVAAS